MIKSPPVIGVDARWLLCERMSPHSALLKVMLLTNQRSPFNAVFILYTDSEPVNKASICSDNVVVRVVQSSTQLKHIMADERWLNIVLPQIARKDKLDLFFSPYYKIPLSLRVPRINMIHDLSFFVLPENLLSGLHRSCLRRWLLKRAMRFYSRESITTLTVSKYSKRCLIEILGLHSDHVEICWNGMDAEMFRNLPVQAFERLKVRYSLPAQYLLYVGSNLRKKNLDGLIRAYAALPKEQRLRFPLVLKTSIGILAHLVKELGLTEQIVFIEDYLPDSDIAVLIRGAKALVLISFDEGFGIPVVEAMAAGVMVVVSREGALEEVVGDAGMLVDPYRPEDTTKALITILTASDQQYRRWSERCLSRAKLFSNKTVAEHFFSVITQTYNS